MNAPFWVIDTNVLVSGVLTPTGTCAQVLDLVRDGKINAAWTPAMLSEYAEVLRRPKFKLPATAVTNLLRTFADAWRVQPKLSPALPDADDEPFLAAALATAEKILVTGNVADYPPKQRAGVTVITPREALDRFAG